MLSLVLVKEIKFYFDFINISLIFINKYKIFIDISKNILKNIYNKKVISSVRNFFLRY